MLVRNFLICLMAVMVSVIGSGFAVAEDDADALLAQIKARSEKTKQFRDLLNDPDQTTRLAALDVMLKSDDLAMRELAFSVGFSSADDAMRSVCLKNKFNYLKTLPIKLTAREKATENEKKTLERFGSSYPLDIKEYDVNTGTTKFTSRSDAIGQVSGTGFEFKDGICNGRFVLGDEPVLTGELACTSSYEGVYPATIRLQ